MMKAGMARNQPRVLRGVDAAHLVQRVRPRRVVAMNSAWNLLTGTATKYVLLAVNIALGIFLMPYTVRHLGTSEYGLWMLVASMTAYFHLLDLGYGNGLVRHVADADARGNVTLVNQILSTFVVVYVGLGVLAAPAAVAMIVWVIPHFPNLLPSQIPARPFHSRRHRRPHCARLPDDGVRRRHDGAPAVCAEQLRRHHFDCRQRRGAVHAARSRLSRPRCRRGVGHRRPAYLRRLRVDGQTRLPGAAPSAVRIHHVAGARRHRVQPLCVRHHIAVQIGFNLDNIVVGAALGTSAVAVYAVTLRLAEAQRQLSNQFNTLMFPVVVRYGADNDPEALRRMLIEGTRLSLTLVCGLTVCLIGFARPLITRWMGPGFEGAVAPLYVLAVAGVVLVGQAPLGNILLGTGRHRLVAFVSLAEAIANLVLSIILVRRFGLLGVAFGTGVPVFIANVFVLAPAACRQLGLRRRRLRTRRAVAPVVGAASPRRWRFDRSRRLAAAVD